MYPLGVISEGSEPFYGPLGALSPFRIQDVIEVAPPLDDSHFCRLFVGIHLVKPIQIRLEAGLGLCIVRQLYGVGLELPRLISGLERLR